MKKNFAYVDAFVVPVPRKNLKLYIKWARISAKIWIEHGALSYVECQAQDLRKGKVTSFPRSVKLKKGELVFLAWATYKSKAHRDRVMHKVMHDIRFAPIMENTPFDGMRMFWGGFKPIAKG